MAGTGTLVKQYGPPRLCLVAALTAVLLRILGSPYFRGGALRANLDRKTTALLPGASAWGFPGRKGPGTCRAAGDLAHATRIQVERRAVADCDMPLLLDDTALAQSPDVVTSMMYDLCAGLGKGQGSVRGHR